MATIGFDLFRYQLAAYVISGALGGLAGFLLAKDSTLFQLFLVPVVPLSLAAAGFLLITKVWTGRLRGRGLAGIKQLNQSLG